MTDGGALIYSNGGGGGGGGGGGLYLVRRQFIPKLIIKSIPHPSMCITGQRTVCLKIRVNSDGFQAWSDGLNSECQCTHRPVLLLIRSPLLRNYLILN